MTSQETWHGRLLNWSIWARSDGLSKSLSLHRDAGPSINDLDAEKVEILLLKLRRFRPPLFKAVWLTYLNKKDDVAASRKMRVTPERYAQMLEEVYRLLERLEING